MPGLRRLAGVLGRASLGWSGVASLTSLVAPTVQWLTHGGGGAQRERGDVQEPPEEAHSWPSPPRHCCPWGPGRGKCAHLPTGGAAQCHRKGLATREGRELRTFLQYPPKHQYVFWFLVVFFFFYFIFIFVMFIIERPRETEHELGRGRERGRHRIRSRLRAPSCQHRARRGAQTHEP